MHIRLSASLLSARASSSPLLTQHILCPQNLDDAASQASTSQADAEEEVEAKQKGVLAVLHGHSRSSVPVFRLLRNNAFGLTANIFFGAWVNGEAHCETAPHE
jgi:hypothetical protein